jgi:hypothetical protein
LLANLDIGLIPGQTKAAREIGILGAIGLKEAVLDGEQVKREAGFNQAFRLLWVLLSSVWTGWKTAADLMKPKTVLRWHEHARKTKSCCRRAKISACRTKRVRKQSRRQKSRVSIGPETLHAVALQMQ